MPLTTVPLANLYILKPESKLHEKLKLKDTYKEFKGIVRQPEFIIEDNTDFLPYMEYFTKYSPLKPPFKVTYVKDKLDKLLLVSVIFSEEDIPAIQDALDEIEPMKIGSDGQKDVYLFGHYNWHLTSFDETVGKKELRLLFQALLSNRELK